MSFAILPLSADSNKLLCKSGQISLEILVVKQVHKTVRFGVTCRMSLLRGRCRFPYARRTPPEETFHPMAQASSLDTCHLRI
ncbi:hypothetical protein EI42_04321 [Thermosporothrix hazakensis]|jgi:hypothetical protein|uniref:Uncharacterized protein n=1 Tax=Thermosporothrix hazakensis TaxID=644383 RepID=A0A326U1X1_THEHA|nr:hypothetical protein EI42_04321 [Thermosporothrix hazakensis]